MKHLIVTGIVVWTIALSASAQTQKLCSEYLSTTEASSILGGPTQAEPANGQYSRDDKLEWHFCDWRSASSKLALNVSLQRWKTEGEMRGSILTGDPKVKVERLARLGELGAVYTNHELGAIVVVGSKGTKVVSVALQAPPKQIPSESRRRLEKLAETLWSKL